MKKEEGAYEEAHKCQKDLFELCRKQKSMYERKWKAMKEKIMAKIGPDADENQYTKIVEVSCF